MPCRFSMASAACSTAAPAADRGNRKERVGEVISNKMTKTIVVRVERRFAHPRHGLQVLLVVLQEHLVGRPAGLQRDEGVELVRGVDGLADGLRVHRDMDRRLEMLAVDDRGHEARHAGYVQWLQMRGK